MARHCAALVLALVSGLSVAAAQDGLPALHTGEAEVDETLRLSTLDVGDPMAVFAYVLGRLPGRVNVYPTENYYYFRFVHNGQPYAGSIRLAASSRDQGKVNFVYGEQLSGWRLDLEPTHVILDAAKGVTVERLEPLAYRVAYGGKSVVFALNDLSAAKPPPGAIKTGEKLLGPIFDDSAVRFFLVFNPRLKVFHFVLDESVPPSDEFLPAGVGGLIAIGKRTGFAFYRTEGRSILIGVYRRNVELNNAFDGPFDQLPENFIEGDELRDAMIAVSPEVKGEIDRFGNFNDDGRYLLRPYLLYDRPQELAIFHRCMTDRKVAPANRPLCFVISDDEQPKRNPRPQAYTSKGR